MTLLTQARCTPLHGSEHRLSDTQCQANLAQLADWYIADDGHVLRKTFHFTDYYQTMAFVNALAYIAHAENHHPDLSVHYNRCDVSWSTHDVGGLSQNDFICAAKTDALC
jgi:4a-hydroxytetrahydrobiopterin dehydratase